MTDTSPICAGCGVAITKGMGNRVAIVGSEAFHQRCVRAGLVATSKQRRLEQMLRDAEARAETNRVMAREALDLLQREQEKTAEVRSLLDASRRSNTGNLARVHDLIARNAELEQERDAARREAALHQVIQATPAPRSDPPPVITTPEEEVDGTKKRFEMLELD